MMPHLNPQTPRRKAVVLDLDGTLLDSRKRVPPANAACVRALGSNPEVLLIFATARPPRASYPLLEGLADEGHLICYNGALILHRRKREHCTMIPAVVVKKLIHTVARDFPTLACGLEHDDQMYSLGHFDRHFPRDYQACLGFGELPVEDTPKILIDIPCQEIGERVMASLPPECGCVLTDRGGLLQVMARGVSKRSAVGELLRQHGIQWSDTICFGDDLNDLELFSACGTSVAMANAHPTLAETATHRTTSNDEAGVAAALARLFPASLRAAG